MFQTKTKQKSFRELHTVQERQAIFKDKISHYPDMIPVILEKHPKSKIQHLNKQLYFLPQNIDIYFRMIQFRDTIKSTLQISSKQSLYFHIGNQVLPEDIKLADIYEKKKDSEDGFLYITFSDLEVFGFNSN
ncbi:unnamed protein product (macronuclear) [Paramecium tetraurelia]|uniref:Autophagy-related protein n=1 Tax=Paramecium tetraurelia TaxID=5888 RepID=A0DB29_PARTE|nr:uncharacterized protein GSPATT00015140001 [Paramecium tetraurelia]CAK80246.1 unnamed protein product [Paramecium tetraurelia]|eukprot:XP_001447643.1 hypothetical protein (macronuclear) [Paramecium tetraurelia strain d4-2]